jgi:hypothetical protein
MVWTLHFLNARGTIGPLETLLRATLLDACGMLGARGQRVLLDVVVRGETRVTPARLAVGGHAPGPGVIELVIDLAAAIGPEALRDEILKTLFHEYHHALRWEGPGYGLTLGEALVSEGLAQAFVHEMLDCPPEPWEIMPPGVDLEQLCRRADAAFDDQDYPHDTWFFGSGDLPEWTGYALGSALVAAHLDRAAATALDLVHAPAAGFRDLLDLLCKPGRGNPGP